MANTIYFIDFENVNSTSNLNFSVTEETDEIILVYTKNVEKISLDIIKGMKAKLSVYKVSNGSQQLDMQLSSRLGFMIGKYGNTRKYVVISKDNDYAHTIESWQEEGITVTQDAYLGVTPLLLPEKSSSEVPEKKQKETKANTPKKKKETNNQKSQLNSRIMKRFNKEYEPAEVGKIASIVVKDLNKKGGSRLIYTELVKTFKKEKGLQIYHILKNEGFLK